MNEMIYLTPKMVSETLHIGRNKAYKLFNLQGFPAVRIGKQFLVDADSLKRFLQEHEGSRITLS